MLKRFASSIRSQSLLVALLAGGFCGQAVADGAFPDSLGLFVPPGRPDDLVLTTNFGVLVSRDSGANWHLVCETVSGRYAWLFQMGPQPNNRLYSMSLDGLLFSDDLGCNWTQSADAPPTRRVTDLYPDPRSQSRVLVWGTTTLDGGAVTGALYESADGANTFGQPVLLLAPNQAATGVEISAQVSDVAYATWHERGTQPFLGGTTNGGDSWSVLDLKPSLGEVIPRILLVDPSDPGRVYLRLSGFGVDSLGIIEDGGQTSRVALQLDARMTAFLRRPDGRLIVSTGDGRSWISNDAGTDFQSWGPTYRFRALSQRDGVIYAGTDDVQDGFAVAKSSDDGQSWTKLLAFNEIRGIAPCGDLPNSCAVDWLGVKYQFGIDDGADAGATDAGSRAAFDAGAAGPVGGGNGGEEPRSCGCAEAPALLLLPLLAALVFAARRRAGAR